MNIRAPGPAELGKVMEGLFDRKVSVTPQKVVGRLPNPVIFAVYEGRTGESVVVIACDLPLAAHAGAVLSLFPAGVAVDAVKSGKLPDNLMENYAEVVNVLASTFNSLDGSVHVRLRSCAMTPLGGDALPLLKKFKVEYTVNIAGYAVGRMLIAM